MWGVGLLPCIGTCVQCYYYVRPGRPGFIRGIWAGNAGFSHGNGRPGPVPCVIKWSGTGLDLCA